MAYSFRTHLPVRHDRVFVLNEDPRPISMSFRTQVPVRPARLVFRGPIEPHSEDLAWWIHEHWPIDGGEEESEHYVAHFPFVYRGYIAAVPEGEEDVPVRLWEEPSGRPLEAELPRGWFEALTLHRGMPFRMVTWMVERASGALEPRHRLVKLGATAPCGEAIQ